MDSQTFQLLMREGPTPGKIITLTKGELVIGREVDNDIIINIAEVSRRHARLTKKTGGYIIEDLGSTNGTFVNGQRILGPHVLRPGEVIMLGDAVSLLYGLAGVDINATVISAAPIKAPAQQAPPPPPRPAPVIKPVQEPIQEEKKKSWVLAGVGCLVVLCVLVVAGAFLFDYLNMYCTPPFNAFFPCP